MDTVYVIARDLGDGNVEFWESGRGFVPVYPSAGAAANSADRWGSWSDVWSIYALSPVTG